MVAVLAAGLTVSAFGRSRIAPYNWSFIADLWAQIAFWAHSLVFVLASILVPKLLLDMQFHDVVLVAALIAAAFAARFLVLFLLLPLLSFAKLTQPISTAYKLAIVWGGLRGALTLVLALAVTENPAVRPDVQQFVAVLATGLVLFTLLINGTTLSAVIHLLRPRSPFAGRPGVARPGSGALLCGIARDDSRRPRASTRSRPRPLDQRARAL